MNGTATAPSLGLARAAGAAASEARTLWALAALGCAVRVLVVTFAGWRAITADAQGYDTLGWSLAQGHGFAMVPGQPTANYPPLYPAWLALVYAAAGHQPAVAWIAQLVLGCATPVLMSLLAREWLPRRVALVAGVIGALYGGFIGAELLLLAESLTVMLWLVVHLGLSRHARTGRLGWIAAAGGVMGLSILAKPLLLFYPPIMGWWLWRHSPRHAAAALLWAACSIAPLVPWTLRNYAALHAWIPIATYGGKTLYASYFPENPRSLGSNPTAVDPVVREAEQRGSEVGEDRFFLETTWRRLWREPRGVIRLLAYKSLWFWSPLDWEIVSWDGHAAYNWGYLFLLPFAVGGIWGVVRQRLDASWLLIPFLYMAGICMVFLALPRYRLLAEPYLFIFSAAGLVAWLTTRRPALRRLAAAGWLTGQLVVAARLPALLTWLHSLRGG